MPRSGPRGRWPPPDPGTRPRSAWPVLGGRGQREAGVGAGPRPTEDLAAPPHEVATEREAAAQEGPHLIGRAYDLPRLLEFVPPLGAGPGTERIADHHPDDRSHLILLRYHW